LKEQVELSHQLLDQFGREQQILQKRLEATGQAVANLTLDQLRAAAEAVPDSPRFSTIHEHQSHPHQRQCPEGNNHAHTTVDAGRVAQENCGGYRSHLPEMSFPRFDGQNPKIWKDKCMDYFTVFNLPPQSWVPTATMHFDDNGPA
jgi:hypothetical protein